MSDEIQREAGDDVVVALRIRRSALEALRGDGLEVSGRMGLIEGGDGVYAIIVWSARLPDWPDPIPGNEESRLELDRRRDG